MTPEQETYKEYGRAQEALHQTIKEIKKNPFLLLGSHIASLRSWKGRVYPMLWVYAIKSAMSAKCVPHAGHGHSRP